MSSWDRGLHTWLKYICFLKEHLIERDIEPIAKPQEHIHFRYALALAPVLNRISREI